jgi:hypothetical protein
MRFLGRVECSIKNSDIVLAEIAFAVWSVGCENGTNTVEIFGINWFAVEAALPELYAHDLEPALSVARIL